LLVGVVALEGEISDADDHIKTNQNRPHPIQQMSTDLQTAGHTAQG
jgi:hypothetical protein